MASLSNNGLGGLAHPPRSNPPLRSSSGPPRPCITPSTETCVVVVSFTVAGPFSLGWSSFGKTGPPHRSHRSCHGPCCSSLRIWQLPRLGHAGACRGFHDE